MATDKGRCSEQHKKRYKETRKRITVSEGMGKELRTYMHEKAVFDAHVGHMCVDYTKGIPHQEGWELA